MERTGLLVAPDDLAAELRGTRPPTVLDVRWRLGGPPAAGQYRRGHLPSAVLVDLDRDLAGPPGAGGRHPLPDAGALQASLRRWGIRGGSAVVVYDDADGTSAARAWWLLCWAGLRDVRLLDGGLAGWLAAGLPLATAVPSPPAGDVVVRPAAMAVLDAAGAALVAASGVLLDARVGPRYRGEVEPVDPVAGHIPGAVSAPTADNVDASGRFLDAAVLRARFASLGVPLGSGSGGSAGTGSGETGAPAGTPVGTYCGSGVTAAHQVLALALAGVEAALYVGSWSEWVADPRRPVAVGAEPGRQPDGVVSGKTS